MPDAPDPDTARQLQPLGAYDWPSMPAEEALHRAAVRLKALFRRDDQPDVVADDQLQPATLEMLDGVVAPPASGPVLDELARSVDAWQADPEANPLMVVVVPPCDDNDLLATFASQRGLQTLTAPSREVLASSHPARLPPLGGDGLLVLPRLERWFLRHRDGLGTIRALLSALYDQDRRSLIGVNSWAWAFLVKAVDANLLLPEPVTFHPFDAERLRDWFGTLARADATRQIEFRFSDSGESVFPTSGTAGDHYFRTLAARSLGIPWVAWHLWRLSLYRDMPSGSDGTDAPGETDTPSETASAAGAETFWVGAFDPVLLPGSHPQTALLVLHALLIHGSLTPDEIRRTVPLVGEPNIVPSLLRAGFVEHGDGSIRCRPAAYPSVRAALADAGFPVDTL